MNRKQFLGLLGAGLAGCAVGGRTEETVVAGARGAPAVRNVLLIYVDDLNDWVGALGGHPQAYTPNIDRLLRRGTMFTNAHCPAPVCNPSRAATMTGVAPHNTGVYRNSTAWQIARPDLVPLPQHLRRNGITTFGAGKIYHDPYPHPPSWDQRFPERCDQRPAEPRPDGAPYANANAELGDNAMDWGTLDSGIEIGDVEVASWMGGQLRRRHSSPFFAVCGIYKPHTPWYVSERHRSRIPSAADIVLPASVPSDWNDLPEGHFARRFVYDAALRDGLWRDVVAAYLSAVVAADEQIGVVLDALDAGPNADDTAIVLLTDHGFHLGEKSTLGKSTLWDEATRVPFGMVIPGVGSAGQVCNVPVSLLDVYPTVLDILGLSAPQPLDGVSVLDLVRNPSARLAREAVLTTYLQANHSLRTERWRYIRYDTGGEELYDHETDPLEIDNLISNPAVADVAAYLRAMLPATNVVDAGDNRARFVCT